VVDIPVLVSAQQGVLDTWVLLAGAQVAEVVHRNTDNMLIRLHSFLYNTGKLPSPHPISDGESGT
jgi:hypothetical protein